MQVAEINVGLLLYFVGTEHIYALLVDQQGHTQEFKLAPWEKTFPRIDKLHEKMERGSLSAVNAPPEFNAFSFEWGKELLPPFAYLEPFDVLVIIPHHTLHSLPFHTVWIEEEKQFLATSLGMTYCSSGTLLTRCIDRNLARKSDLAVWEFALDEDGPVAGPDPPRRCVGIGADIIGDKTEDYRGLAESFTSYFDDPITFPLASRHIKIRLTGDERWETLCIVCHGHYDSATSDNSGLLLEQDPVGIAMRPIFLHRGTYYDFRDLPFKYLPVEVEASREAELMTVSELKVDCRTDAQLVALFGCSTGAGHVISGDDVNSMGYQWLKIGAASVLANLWESNINFVARWSPLFLNNWLVKRQPKAIAWQQAHKEMLNQNPEIEPYEWGAMTLLGDWL
ncbi:MAG: CHAT domain-containing protein [bacterium]